MWNSNNEGYLCSACFHSQGGRPEWFTVTLTTIPHTQKHIDGGRPEWFTVTLTTVTHTQKHIDGGRPEWFTVTLTTVTHTQKHIDGGRPEWFTVTLTTVTHMQKRIDGGRPEWFTVTLTTITHTQKHIDEKGEGGTQAPETKRKLDKLETLTERVYAHFKRDDSKNCCQGGVYNWREETDGWLVKLVLSLKRYWRGPRSQEVGVRKRLYLTLYTLSPPGFLHFKMGSDESHFKVSFIVRDKVTKTVSPDHNFWRERCLCLPA